MGALAAFADGLNETNIYFFVAGLLVMSVLRVGLTASFAFSLIHFFKRCLKKITPAPWVRWELFRDFILSSASVMLFQLVTVFSILGWRAGICHLYFNINDYGRGYFYFTLILNLFIFDAYFYWTHRMLHQRFLMKHVHLIHHECQNLSVLSAYAFHPIEAFTYPWGIILICLFIPVHVEVFLLTQLFVLFHNMTLHCGYTIFSEKFSNYPILKYWMRPVHHEDHHNRHPHHNYAFFFNIWDRAMGTYRPSRLVG